jgi:hypothetical protein
MLRKLYVDAVLVGVEILKRRVSKTPEEVSTVQSGYSGKRAEKRFTGIQQNP